MENYGTAIDYLDRRGGRYVSLVLVVVLILAHHLVRERPR